MGLPEFDFGELRRKLERIDLREWVQEHTVAAAVAGGVVLVLVLAVLWMNLGGGGGSSSVATGEIYFYDLNTGELFAVPSTEIAPIDTGEPYTRADGTEMPAGVLAHVFSRTGDPTDVGSHVMVYVETYKPQMRERIVAARESGDVQELQRVLGELEFGGSFVMDPEAESPRWFPANSVAGGEMKREALRRKAPQGKRECYPGGR